MHGVGLFFFFFFDRGSAFYNDDIRYFTRASCATNRFAVCTRLTSQPRGFPVLWDYLPCHVCTRLTSINRRLLDISVLRAPFVRS
jgi:hypothetical protein